MDENWIAPCGVDCKNCDVFRANGKTAVWARVAPLLGKTPEEVACAGCRAKHGCTIHANCATLACVEAKGVKYCSDCAEFPCHRLMTVADRADRLTQNIKLWNLCRIRLLGEEKFLEEAVHNRALYFRGKLEIGSAPVLPAEGERPAP